MVSMVVQVAVGGPVFLLGFFARALHTRRNKNAFADNMEDNMVVRHGFLQDRVLTEVTTTEVDKVTYGWFHSRTYHLKDSTETYHNVDIRYPADANQPPRQIVTKRFRVGTRYYEENFSNFAGKDLSKPIPIRVHRHAPRYSQLEYYYQPAPRDNVTLWAVIWVACIIVNVIACSYLEIRNGTIPVYAGLCIFLTAILNSAYIFAGGRDFVESTCFQLGKLNRETNPDVPGTQFEGMIADAREVSPLPTDYPAPRELPPAPRPAPIPPATALVLNCCGGTSQKQAVVAAIALAALSCLFCVLVFLVPVHRESVISWTSSSVVYYLFEEKSSPVTDLSSFEFMNGTNFNAGASNVEVVKIGLIGEGSEFMAVSRGYIHHPFSQYTHHLLVAMLFLAIFASLAVAFSGILCPGRRYGCCFSIVGAVVCLGAVEILLLYAFIGEGVILMLCNVVWLLVSSCLLGRARVAWHDSRKPEPANGAREETQVVSLVPVSIEDPSSFFNEQAPTPALMRSQSALYEIGPADVTPGSESLKAFMSEIQLEVYFDPMVHMGYDKLEDIVHLADEDFEIMCEIIECKPGHVMKLKRELGKYRQLSDPNAVPTY